MIGLLLVGHGNTASEALAALIHITGAQPQTAALAVKNDANIDDCQLKLSQLIERVDSGDGVCVLVDMYGATPSNVACKTIAGRDDITLIAGFSLPLLIKISALRVTSKKNLLTMTKEARDAGRARMLLAAELPIMQVGHG
ncbi:MAG: hypothetical protein R8M38_05335 [Mariprofundaceae bacterium]